MPSPDRRDRSRMNPEQIVELRQARYNATVTWMHKSHADLMILRVRPDFPLPMHKTGQYSTLGMGYWEPRHSGCQEEQLQPGEETKLAKRAYSISSSILDDRGELLDRSQVDWLEFYVVLVRESDRPKPPALTP
jgi:ferredoxin--NADP+ reductase